MWVLTTSTGLMTVVVASPVSMLAQSWARKPSSQSAATRIAWAPAAVSGQRRREAGRGRQAADLLRLVVRRALHRSQGGAAQNGGPCPCRSRLAARGESRSRGGGRPNARQLSAPVHGRCGLARGVGGDAPRHRPATPSRSTMLRSTAAALSPSPPACIRVFTKSSGLATAAAIPPDTEAAQMRRSSRPAWLPSLPLGGRPKAPFSGWYRPSRRPP